MEWGIIELLHCRKEGAERLIASKCVVVAEELVLKIEQPIRAVQKDVFIRPVRCLAAFKGGQDIGDGRGARTHITRWDKYRVLRRRIFCLASFVHKIASQKYITSSKLSERVFQLCLAHCLFEENGPECLADKTAFQGMYCCGRESALGIEDRKIPQEAARFA